MQFFAYTLQYLMYVIIHFANVLSDLFGNLSVFKNCYTSIENRVHTLHESQTYIYLIGHILCADVVYGDNYKTIFLFWRKDTSPKTGQ